MLGPGVSDRLFKRTPAATFLTKEGAMALDIGAALINPPDVFLFQR